jgi:hypothetical protein
MKLQAEAEHEARLAAERLGMPFLVYRDGEGRQRIHPLERGRRSVTIGRRDEADVSLPWDPECSRLHAELELRAGEWMISDDGLSQNGTWVNELRLVGRRRLSDGDDVRVGRTHLIFANPVSVGIGPTLVPGELRGLCRPLLGDGVGLEPATDEQIARETGIPAETVRSELDHLTRALGLHDVRAGERRRELALLALRSGLVAADDNG